MTSKDNQPNHVDKIVENLIHSKPKYIIGVGASAGGLPSLRAFFKGLPYDIDAAVIVVQHLSPDFKSIMDELLAKESSFPIKLAKDMDLLESKTVYILPSRKNISITSSRILLSDVDDRPVHHPIDYLFRSMAEEYQNDAVGIVLSGTGSDGSLGVSQLREVGALTIAEIPEYAEFSGMPSSAIDTGAIKFVLKPIEMGKQIAEYFSHSQHLVNDKVAKDTSDNTLSLEKIFDTIYAAGRIDLRSYKLTTVERRVKHRMTVLKLVKMDEYIDYFLNNEDEQDLLVQDISIGVTQFFRNRHVWNYFAQSVVDRLILETSLDDVLRVWVPGCSTGEEAYTIAILFDEAMNRLDERRDIRIFASDIDRAAIRAAAIGQYSNAIEADIDASLLEKHFVKNEQGYCVKERLRKRVVFAAHNLLEDPPFSNMDLVSCRNLLIYFQIRAQKDILSFLHFSLKPSGYLILGEAETTSSLPNYFQEIDNRSHIYKRARNTRVSLSTVGLENRLARHKKSLKHHQSYYKQAHSFDGTITRIKDTLFNRYVPPTFVLDNALNLIYSFGDTDAYTKKLKAGSQSLHYASFLEDSLVSVVGSLIKQVEQHKKNILLKDVLVQETNQPIVIEASYVPLGENVIAGHYILTMMKSSHNEQMTNEQIESAYSPQQSNLRIQQLDAELLDVRVLLGESQQDVEALTEELQATNEELMASNEELQSTNEELQSVNEELFTVNSEYQEKIDELTQSNQDLDSLLNATQVGVVYLDKYSLIRRFTPKSRDYINLLPLDINRPFSDIALNFELPELNNHLEFVKQNNEKRHLKITKLKGQSANILLTLLPYLDKNYEYEGIILVFQDIKAYNRVYKKINT